VRLNDQVVARAEYATGERLDGCRSTYARHPTTGPRKHGVETLEADVQLRGLVGPGPRPATPFSAENGRELLERHFVRVALHDAGRTVEFPDREAAVEYVAASATPFSPTGDVPELDGPLPVTRHSVVFVADEA
jgi:hypothetical protein